MPIKQGKVTHCNIDVRLAKLTCQILDAGVTQRGYQDHQQEEQKGGRATPHRGHTWDNPPAQGASHRKRTAVDADCSLDTGYQNISDTAARITQQEATQQTSPRSRFVSNSRVAVRPMF